MRNAVIEVVNMSWPTIVIVSSVLIIMRITLLVKGEKRGFVLHEELLNLMFVVYLIALFELVTSQDLPGGGINLTPFREILRYDYGTSAFYKQVFGNILLFLPFGYFVSRYCKIRSLFVIMIMTLLTSGIVECTQHYIGRSFDVDDIILNTLGGIIGFLIYIALNAIKNHLPKFLRKRWFYNILSIIVVVLMILYVFRII